MPKRQVREGARTISLYWEPSRKVWLLQAYDGQGTPVFPRPLVSEWTGAIGPTELRLIARSCMERAEELLPF